MSTPEQYPLPPTKEIWNGHHLYDMCPKLSEREFQRRQDFILGRSGAILETYLQKPTTKPRVSFQDGETFNPSAVPPGTVLKLSGIGRSLWSVVLSDPGEEILYGVTHEKGEKTFVDTLNSRREVEQAFAAFKLAVLNTGIFSENTYDASRRTINATNGFEILKERIQTGLACIHTRTRERGHRIEYFFRIDRVDVMDYGEMESEKTKQRTGVRRLIPRRT